VTITCPKCGRIINDPSGECSNCGLNYNEYVKKRDKRKAEIMKNPESARKKIKISLPLAILLLFINSLFLVILSALNPKSEIGINVYAICLVLGMMLAMFLACVVLVKIAKIIWYKIYDKFGKKIDKVVFGTAVILTISIWTIAVVAAGYYWIPQIWRSKPDTQQISKAQQAKPETPRKSRKKSSSWGQCSTEFERNVCAFILEAYHQYDKILDMYPPGYEREKYTHRLLNDVLKIQFEVSPTIGPVNSQNEQVSSQTDKLFMAFRNYVNMHKLADGGFGYHEGLKQAYAEYRKVVHYCEPCLE